MRRVQAANLCPLDARLRTLSFSVRTTTQQESPGERNGGADLRLVAEV